MYKRNVVLTGCCKWAFSGRFRQVCLDLKAQPVSPFDLAADFQTHNVVKSDLSLPESIRSLFNHFTHWLIAINWHWVNCWWCQCWCWAPSPFFSQPWLEAYLFCGGTLVWCNTRFSHESDRYINYAFFCVKYVLWKHTALILLRIHKPLITSCFLVLTFK